MLARMTSAEVSAWMALFAVHHEEDEHRKDLAESGDGQVIEYGRRPDDDEGDDDDGQSD